MVSVSSAPTISNISRFSSPDAGVTRFSSPDTQNTRFSSPDTEKAIFSSYDTDKARFSSPDGRINRYSSKNTTAVTSGSTKRCLTDSSSGEGELNYSVSFIPFWQNLLKTPFVLLSLMFNLDFECKKKCSRKSLLRKAECDIFSQSY